MKTHLKFTPLVTAAMLAVLFSPLSRLQLHAEGEIKEEKMLTIGSKAPALDIENWVSDGKGEFKKVTEFESDKVYIVEFWATWCGPCVASMPHLNELQKEFKKKNVQLISISSEDLETVEGFLKREVRGGTPGQTYAELTSSYCLTCDSDRSVSKDYMVAAGQSGIPCAFIVGKTGLIEWIGHPMSINEPLTQIVDGSWKRDVFAATFKEEQLFDAVVKPQVMAAYRAGDFGKAVEVLDKALLTLTNKELTATAKSMRQAILLLGGGEKAVQEVTTFLQKNKENTEKLSELGRRIYMMAARDQVDKGVVKAGIELAKQCQKNIPESPEPHELLSHLYHIHGDLDNAIAAQKKVIAAFTDKKEEAPEGVTSYLDDLLAEKEKQAAEAKKEETEPKPQSKS